MTKRKVTVSNPFYPADTVEMEVDTHERETARVELSSEEPHHGWVLVTRIGEKVELFGFFTTVRKAILTMRALSASRYDYKPMLFVHPAVLMHNEILWSSETDEEKGMKDLSNQVCITPWEMKIWKEELLELRADIER